MNALLEKFPEAKETTILLAKKCEDEDYSALLVTCYICETNGHVAARCKAIRINFDHEETKKKWLEKRGNSNTKYINPKHDLNPSYRRVPKPMQ